MFLPLPNLDDRRWADLVEEGRALIPLYAPDWTDHNISDPGITLIELFASIAEMDIYQLNRIPARQRLKFLALIGVLPEPPRPARTVLSFRPEAPNRTVSLPATLEFEGRDPFGQPTRFRTLRPIQVVSGELAAIRCQYQKRSLDLTNRWQRGEPLILFGDNPQPGAELYLGFSEPLPAGVQVSLFLTFSDLWQSQQEKDRIEEINRTREACRPVKFPSCQ
jgi:predicted phage baseplate assembly protein